MKESLILVSYSVFSLCREDTRGALKEDYYRYNPLAPKSVGLCNMLVYVI